MAKVLIAGGTGFVGQLLESHLTQSGHEVRILTRNPKKDNHVGWRPCHEEMDPRCAETEVLINLCGAGIADERWTASRKKELLESRTEPLLCLSEHAKNWSNLRLMISSSGIDCYPTNMSHPAKEHDAYSSNFIGELVETWESAMSTFPLHVRVVKMRMPLILHADGGALKKLLKIFKFGLGSPLGSGKQAVNWLHYKDLMRFIEFAMENDHVLGAFNLCGQSISNRLWTRAIGKASNSRLWLPAVPGFVLKMVLGEMAQVLLTGAEASNEKMLQSGFKLKYERVDSALNDLLQS